MRWMYPFAAAAAAAVKVFLFYFRLCSHAMESQIFDFSSLWRKIVAGNLRRKFVSARFRAAAAC